MFGYMEISNPSSTYYTYDTRSKHNCFNLRWTFLKYSKLEINKEYAISSVWPLPECCLELVFKKDDASLYLYVLNKLKGVVRSDLAVSMFDSDGKQLYAFRKVRAVFHKEKFDLFPSIDLDLYRSFNACPSDTVIFDIGFRLEDVSTWDTLGPRSCSHWTRRSNFAEDLKKHVLERLPRSVVLRPSDGSGGVEVNQALLCARSSVFRSMFVRHATCERENDAVLIDDVSGPALRDLVGFVNEADVDLGDASVRRLRELYYAADKYDVPDLRKVCGAGLARRLSRENVCEVLATANKHCDDRLKTDCMLFIRRFFVQFMDSEDWRNLKASDPQLAFEIVEFNVKDLS